MTKVVTYGYIEPDSDEVKILKRKQFWKSVFLLRRSRDNRTWLKITAELRRKTRSTEQNAYYWGVVISCFVDAYEELTGEIWHKDKAHEELSKRFLPKKEVVSELTGEIMETTKSTTECTTVEFMEYLEECRRWIAEFFGVDVPEPEQQGELF